MSGRTPGCAARRFPAPLRGVERWLAALGASLALGALAPGAPRAVAAASTGAQRAGALQSGEIRPGAARAQGGASIRWKGRALDLAAPAAELPAALRSALVTWDSWAVERRYRFEVEASARVVLVVPEGLGGTARYSSGVERALAMLDQRLPQPVRAPASQGVEPTPSTASGAGRLPEDPESPPARSGKSIEDVRKGEATSWGVGASPLETETIVMFALRDERDFASVLDALVALAPDLAAWRGAAERFPGFALESPLVGAVVLGAAGQEEFDPENEVVHRVAELSLLRRFGRQPYWLQQGWAWHVEIAVRKSVYCFPYRDGFVGIGEHGQWDKSLRALWVKAKDPLAMQHVAALQRGQWDDAAAKQAWGVVAFLDRFHSPSFPPLLDALREAWERGSRRDLGAGRWERDPHYELPLAEQRRLIEACAGPDALGDLQRFFAHGTAPAPATR